MSARLQRRLHSSPGSTSFERVGDLCSIFSGFAFSSSFFNSARDGLPLIRIRDVNTGFSDTYYSGEYDDRFLVKHGDILIGMDGDFGISRWQHGLGLLNQRVCRIEGVSSRVLPNFLYMQLQGVLGKINAGIQSSTVKHLSARMLADSRIPVPPLEVQLEIVSILDGFPNLEADLQAELEARRAQFSYYRDSLVKPRWDCEWRTLREVALDFGRGKSRHRPRNDPRLYDGPYPFIQTGDVRNSGHHIDKYSQTYSEKGLAQSKLWPRGTICITIAANIAETGILAFEACFPDSVIGLVVDPERAATSYVEYLLQSFRSSLVAEGKGSAQANINLATFEEMRFPFPELEEQERIAGLLDTFDALVNDLSIGLPAELVARRKQYEYYRDQLLTFGEDNA